MKKLFGTDGVRGIANRELTPEMALQLGRAGAFVLSEGQPLKVLVGKDTRRSGDMLEAALTAGLCSLGAEVYAAGIIPTPGIAYLVRKYNLDAGVMISASHNPMGDNGIKFFNQDGYKLPDKQENEIEQIIFNQKELARPDGKDVGKVICCPNASADYAQFLYSTVPPALDLTGFAVAIDCANGAASHIAESVFSRLGAQVHMLHHHPDGANINNRCGSTHTEILCEYVKAHRMDMGIAFDGDADRIQCVDENGMAVSGDEIMAICAAALQSQGKLKNETLVATVMSNMGLALMCKEKNIRFIQTDVGDRHVMEKMQEGDFIFGGEQSGHIIFKEYGTTGDGMLTGLQLLSIVKHQNQPLSALKKIMDLLPQALVNVKIANEKKPCLAENRALAKVIAQAEDKLKGEGRVLVRPSGTEPVVRVMLEGRDPQMINDWAKQIARCIEVEFS